MDDPFDSEPLTNVGSPAATLAFLHGLSDEEFGYKLQEWHGGGGGDPLYAVGSSLGARHPEVLGKPEIVSGALKSLESIYNSPDSSYGDRMETLALADELKFRQQKYNGSRQAMDNKKAKAWVMDNCKFAMKKTANILALLTPQEKAQIIGDPSTALSVLERKYMERMRMGGEFSRPLSAADIAGDLGAADAALFPGQPQGTLNTPEMVNELLSIVRQNQRAQKPQQKQVVPDPFDTFRQDALKQR